MPRYRIVLENLFVEDASGKTIRALSRGQPILDAACSSPQRLCTANELFLRLIKRDNGAQQLYISVHGAQLVPQQFLSHAVSLDKRNEFFLQYVTYPSEKIVLHQIGVKGRGKIMNVPTQELMQASGLSQKAFFAQAHALVFVRSKKSKRWSVSQPKK